MRRLLCTTLLFSAGLAHAEVPRVATDIAPIHSLVSMVMQGAGSPDLIIPPGASPHSYAMRPSEARAVAKADLVVWVGPSLAPWLEEPMSSLAQGAERLTLQDVEGIRLLTNRSVSNVVCSLVVGDRFRCSFFLYYQVKTTNKFWTFS